MHFTNLHQDFLCLIPIFIILIIFIICDIYKLLIYLLIYLLFLVNLWFIFVTPFRKNSTSVHEIFKQMKLLHTLSFVFLVFSLLFANNTGLPDIERKELKETNQENPENVKSKSVFVAFHDKLVSVPVGYSVNSQVLFGARFILNGETFLAQDYSTIEYFISPIKGGKIVGTYFPKSEGFNEFSSVYGKFIISADGKNGSDLYVVEFSNGSFSKPERLSLNTEYNEFNGIFSNDGEKIYFTSDRPGGFGGLDIYEIELIGKNKWSQPKNLGPSINTAADEQCPFMLKDGMTLYFSSNGHVSNGDFDIYIVTQGDDGEWGDPDKLGEPINSDKDDLYYRMSPDETRAVYYTFGESGEGIYELIFN